MIRAKNYETASKFVKVMPRNTVASFFRTQCRYHGQFDCYTLQCSTALDNDRVMTGVIRFHL